MNFDINRDYKALYPIVAIVIIISAVSLPNLDAYLSIIFAFSSILVGLYGTVRGKGSNVKEENTLGLHPGVVRLILGSITLIIAIISASIQAPQESILSLFGLAGQLLGVAVPALAT